MASGVNSPAALFLMQIQGRARQKANATPARRCCCLVVVFSVMRGFLVMFFVLQYANG